MNTATIHYRLDLVVRLVDTTTGEAVEERNVRFTRDGRSVAPIPRGSGNYVFINCGREDGVLGIEARGYVPCRTPVCYGKLDERLPVLEVLLIPSENTTRGWPVITFSGQLPGLETVQAVDANATGCHITAFDARKRIMTLFRTFYTDLDAVHYGLIHPGEQTFEPFEVVEQVSGDSVKTGEALQKPFTTNAPIARIIFGQVEPDGSYLLRVRDDASKLVYLVRYVVNGEERFRVVDFHQLRDSALE